jgi:peptidoglycan/LPS O-acetylase OafA/YrhL
MTAKDKQRHLSGLDTLRFAAAAWVALFHGARPPLDKLVDLDSAPGKALVALNNGLFNGVAAVMVFFVISGFVIHGANVGRTSLDLRAYYARRLTRIAPPVLIAQALCFALGPSASEHLDAVLWSLYCEIAYYAIYPLLFAAFRRGWTLASFVVASAVAFAIVIATWPVSYYWELPLPVLIVVGLPNWILGCVLAETRAQRRRLEDPGWSIWAWRAGAIVLASGLKALVTHGPLLVGYPASHWLIAVYSFFWISRELDYYAFRRAPRWSEIAGQASFSLYLVHNPVMSRFDLGDATSPLLGAGAFGWTLSWALQLCAIALVTVAFYIAVEKPFHGLARRFGRAVRAPEPALVPERVDERAAA